MSLCCCVCARAKNFVLDISRCLTRRSTYRTIRTMDYLTQLPYITTEYGTGRYLVPVMIVHVVPYRTTTEGIRYYSAGSSYDGCMHDMALVQQACSDKAGWACTTQSRTTELCLKKGWFWKDCQKTCDACLAPDASQQSPPYRLVPPSPPPSNGNWVPSYGTSPRSALRSNRDTSGEFVRSDFSKCRHFALTMLVALPDVLLSPSSPPRPQAELNSSMISQLVASLLLLSALFYLIELLLKRCRTAASGTKHIKLVAWPTQASTTTCHPPRVSCYAPSVPFSFNTPLDHCSPHTNTSKAMRWDGTVHSPRRDRCPHK